MSLRWPERPIRHAAGRPDGCPAAADLIADPLDVTLMRVALSARTGWIPRLLRADHCVRAAQLAELVFSRRRS
jgi:hypothetical protein